MSEFKLESETLPTDEELAGYEELGFIEGVEAMMNGEAVLPIIPDWSGDWDNRCVIVLDFLDFADDDGYFKVVQPQDVSPTGGISYDDDGDRGEYRFSAWEMCNMKFRRLGPWYYHLWKKLTKDEKGVTK